MSKTMYDAGYMWFDSTETATQVHPTRVAMLPTKINPIGTEPTPRSQLHCEITPGLQPNSNKSKKKIDHIQHTVKTTLALTKRWGIR